MSQFDFSVFVCSLSVLPHDGFVVVASAISSTCLLVCIEMEWYRLCSALRSNANTIQTAWTVACPVCVYVCSCGVYK